ncbi:nose resistant to fluoxetine protein 6-like [Saccostrea echinata]|uniref:nose resistant to fluoxetine protein 6-like n=1 Tax=Saccostrea echinata TaxID=191078 RepID=UPI002A814CA4|nr:nose resistant to fluoxetine protein 6-like [Saccostrea echinata]
MSQYHELAGHAKPSRVESKNDSVCNVTSILQLKHNLDRDVKTEKQSSNMPSQSDNSETIHLLSKDSQVPKQTIKHQGQKKRKLQQFLLAFSLSTNGSRVLSTDPLPSSTIQAVSGVKVLSLSWILLFHTHFLTKGSSNISPPWTRHWSFQIIHNAFYAVDSFFVISGLLLSYLTLKELRKRDGRLNWPMFYFHRFWRLTPAMMLVILVNTAYFQYWGSGPYWPSRSTDHDQCTRYWWLNLLYIQNFFPIKMQCLRWGWYVACDMQFYVISPLLIYPLYRKPWVGYVIAGAIILIQAVFRGVMSVKLDLSFNSSPNTNVFLNQVYDKPYNSVSAYVIGILTGYIMWKTERRVTIPKLCVVLGWILALGSISSLVFGTNEFYEGHKPSKFVSALYNSFCKTTWGLGLAWIIFICDVGYGGFVNTFLSARLWSPLTRLTYCAYLVSPIIIIVYHLSQRYLIYNSVMNLIFLFMGFWMASYGIAFFVSLAFEVPMIGLERLLLRRNKD